LNITSGPAHRRQDTVSAVSAGKGLCPLITSIDL
jgi:hypothetical protein